MRSIASGERTRIDRGRARAAALGLVLTWSVALGACAHADQTAQAPTPELDLATIPDAAVLRTTDRQGVLDAAYFPDTAALEGVSGAAVLDCKVTASGELDACATVAEFPRGCSFGVAAVRMAAAGILGPPAQADGQPAAGQVVRMKVRFGNPAANGPKRC
jgi:hypothetical protein